MCCPKNSNNNFNLWERIGNPLAKTTELYRPAHNKTAKSIQHFGDILFPRVVLGVGVEPVYFQG